MNSLSWMILNLVLLVAAISSRPLMKKLSSPELPPIEQEEKSSRESKGVRAEPLLASGREPAHLAMDELWEKSLFCPERTERNALDGEAGETPAQAAEKSDFELTGIAWIGRPGEVKPVAVIKQQKAQPRTATRGRSSAPRGRVAVRRPAQAQAAPEPEKPQNVIFAEGDLINDSGYTLLEINTDENSVILARGSERLELKIEFGSAASSERKSLAVTEAINRQKLREQEQKAVAQHAKPVDQAANAAANAAVKAAGEPPPPPGAGGIPVNPNPSPRGSRTGRSVPGSVETQSGTREAGSTSPSSRSGAAVPRSQQQRLQQLYRESAERRARSAQ